MQYIMEHFVFSTTPSGGSATNRMRITHDGKVGIGTDSPSATLDVEVSSTVFAGEFSDGGGVCSRLQDPFLRGNPTICPFMSVPAPAGNRPAGG